MSEKSTDQALATIGDDAKRILGALGGVLDRLASIEERLATMEDGQVKLTRTVERVDHKINALARHLLTNAECEALNIRDARPRSPAPVGEPAL
ncbi:MAG: hypothetical protein ABI193_14805 [Minicystis sp.]